MVLLGYGHSKESVKWSLNDETSLMAMIPDPNEILGVLNKKKQLKRERKQENDLYLLGSIMIWIIVSPITQNMICVKVH